ncbi:MAG: hypothetical protein L3J54_08145 [Draconibacterium sp.]|nr:hypothetical protein [Draconibacterium sp.]
MLQGIPSLSTGKQEMESLGGGWVYGFHLKGKDGIRSGFGNKEYPILNIQ